MTARSNDDYASSADDRAEEGESASWKQQVGDILEGADLPEPAPANGLSPSDAELRAAYEVERRERFLLEEWRQMMGFDLWCLRQFAIGEAEETARDQHTAFRGLEAAGNIRRFAEHRLEEETPCDSDDCKHGHDDDSKEKAAKYRAVLENVAVLEARIRSLNPQAAADFDSGIHRD